MKVLAASQAAPGRAVNEDHVFIVGGLVGVLDGVTQPAGVDSGCVHGSGWYVQRLAYHLTALYLADHDQPLTKLLYDGINSVNEDHQDTCDLAQPNTPASTVCLLREDTDSVDYLVLCDTTLVVERAGSIEVITDDRFRDTITRLHLDAPPPATALSDNRGYTPAKWNHINRAGGYWIAAATPEAANHSLTGTITHPIRRAALLTDGASCAVDSLALMGWRALLDLVQNAGPDQLIQKIRQAEISLSAQTRGTKAHDDATVALCLFEETIIS